MKKNASTSSQARLFVVFLLLVLSGGIVAAIFAFPGAGVGNTVLVAQGCNTGSNGASPGAFSGACTTTNLNLNDGTAQTSATNNNNRYAGINMTAYNSSITNCGGITNVKLCYEWWYNTAAVTLDTCRVKVDADGGASYTNVSTSCPSVTANPGETCIDVTGSESWVCSDFFIASGTRAMAVVEVLFPSAKTLSVDSLYFNVTYTNDLTSPAISIAYPANTTYTSLPLTLNTTIVDDNLQACWWSNNSGATNRTFTCNTNITLGGNVSIGSNRLFVWANDSYGNNATKNVTFFVNVAPTVQNISLSPNPAGTSALMTVVANNVTDANNESLSFFCSESSTSPTDNGLCSGGGNLTSIIFPYSPSCLYYHNRAAGNYTVYCRMYDGVSYSSTVNKTYQVLGDTLTTSVISVAGDATPSYFDTVNNGRTDILVSGATGMSCRWSSNDSAYLGMVSACTIDGSTANCSVNNVASQNFTTRYIACQDTYGNSQNAATNLNVDFYLDYTAPTTSDDSDAQIHVPTYEVTITEADNVDLDPTSYYCFSTVAGCNPSFSIDGGAVISFGTANRDINYLRYYSVDDAGNSQTIVNKTIHINHLPVLTSASDNAATILGGTTVTITSVSSDEDSANQTIKLYVCNESGAISSGCNGGTYCSATGTANLSCGFAAEFDSATHTWYAYLYDSADEAASSNNPLTGSYITDSSGPTIVVVSPSTTSYTQNSISADIVTSETANSAWYNLDGNHTANVTMSNVSATNWVSTVSGLFVGSHNITFYANDSFGNLGESSIVHFTITSPNDTTAPAITIVSPLNASYNSLSPLLNITADEALSSAWYKLNGGASVYFNSSTTTSWYTTLSLSQETTNNITVFVNDSSNNRNNKSIVIYADSLAPRYSSVSALPSSANVSQNVNCSVTWTDGFSISSVIISENSLGSYENHTISFSGISGSASYLILGSKLANVGTYTCRFYATDSAGNINSTSTTFTVSDVTAPTITVTSPTNGGTYNQLSVPLSIVTNENASSAWYFLNTTGLNTTLGNTSATSWNATLSGLTNGVSYLVIFYANDSSGNIGTSGAKTFTINTGSIDTIPPVITIDTIANASYKTSTTVQLNITTNENTIWAGYKLNSGSLTNMTNSSLIKWNVTLSSLVEESTNILEVYANDTSNNTGNTNVTFYVDSVAPRFLNVSAIPSILNETQSVVCNAYVNDTFSFSSVKISENSTISGTFLNHTIDLSSKGYANYTITNVQKGNYTCIFYATDSAGNTNSTSTTFIVNDVAAPVVSINSPLNQSYSTNSILFSITTNENVISANYSLDNGANNVSLTGSGRSWSSLIGLSDGSKTLTFYALDSSGNLGNASVNFAIDTSVNDITPPTITIWSPIEGVYYTSNTVLINISTNENLSWAGYKLDSAAVVNLGNVSMINWNKTLTSVSEGTHSVIFYANDSSTNKNQGTKTANFYVDLNVSSVSSFSCPDKNDSQDVVCSLTATDAVGLDYFIVGDNSSGSWQNSSQIDLSGVSNSTTYTLSAGNTTPGVFGMKVYLFDMAGRMNGSESDLVVIRDDTYPIIENISYSPNTTALLDPGISVNISADISEDYAIGSVKLMYKNSSAASWTSATMTNTTFTSYNASLLTLGAETWYFKINATDAAGNSNISSNYTLVVENDQSYNITSTIPLIKSISSAQMTTNNSLGTLYMNNTGDGDLNFNVTLSSVSLGTRLSVNYTNTKNVNYTAVASGDFRDIIIDVNTTGLDNGLYVYQINIVSSAGTASYENYINIQAVAQPYLVVSIDSYSASVIRGQTGVELKASVSNFGSLDATGVYLSWNLPSGFSLSSGSLIRSLGNIPIGSSSTNTITFDVSSSITESSAVVSANASASNADPDSEIRTVSVTDALVVVVTELVSGGGGGGGAALAKTYSKTVEVVRGSGDSFEIEVANKDYNSSLEDVTIDISGFPSKYMSVSPSKISYIAPRGIGKFLVKLTAPAYKSYEEHDLVAVIKGNLKSGMSSVAYSETQNIKLIIQEISENDTGLILKQAGEALKEMKDKGFNTDSVASLLSQANSQLSEKKNNEAYTLAKQVIDIKEKAVRIDNLIKRIRAVMDNPRKVSLIVGNVAKDIGSEQGAIYLIEQMKKNNNLFDGINTENYNSPITGKVVINEAEINEVLGLALVAFERGDYGIAETRAEEARNLLLLNLKGNFAVFLYLNWPFITLGMVLLSVSGFVGYRKYQKSSLAKRIEDLNREETNLGTLMVISQRKYFLGRMSSGEYHRITFQNQKRLADLRKERINLRNKRIRLISPKEISQNLDIEKMQVEASIRKIQSAYYADKKISESEYDLQFKVFNERLAEIEEERITLRLIEERKGVRKIKARDFNVPEIAHKDVARVEHKIKSSGKTKIFFLKLWGFLKKPFTPIKTLGDKRREAKEKEIRNKIDKMMREKK